MSRQRGKRTVGDYRHYPPEYVKSGDGVTIDRTDPIHPVIHADDQGGITEIQGSSHITVDNTDPKKPTIATSGLVDKVHGTDQIIVDNTDEDNPIIRTTGLVESVGGGGIINNNDPRNPIVSTDDHFIMFDNDGADWSPYSTDVWDHLNWNKLRTAVGSNEILDGYVNPGYVTINAQCCVFVTFTITSKIVASGNGIIFCIFLNDIEFKRGYVNLYVDKTYIPISVSTVIGGLHVGDKLDIKYKAFGSNATTGGIVTYGGFWYPSSFSVSVIR